MRNIRAVKGGRGRPPLQARNVVCSVIQFFSPVRLKGLSHLFLDETAPFFFKYLLPYKRAYVRDGRLLSACRRENARQNLRFRALRVF